jgi:hypothetical protein
VNALLQPGEQTVVKYVYRAPLYASKKKVSVLLSLVNPNDYTKLCEETIAVTVKVNEPKSLIDDTLDF